MNFVVQSRFWNKVDKGPDDKCWLWTAHKVRNGYGRISKEESYGETYMNAIKATYCNFRNIVGRKVLQIHLEVPIEKAGEVYEVLGWPDAADPKWVAVALLNEDKL